MTKAGKEAFVPLLDQGVIELLRRLKAGTNPRGRDRVFPITYNHVRAVIRGGLVVFEDASESFSDRVHAKGRGD